MADEPKIDLLDFQIMRRDIQTTIDKIQVCWVCGRDNLLTEHHAIPQRVESPLLNLKIPICKNCNHAVHYGDDITAILKKIYLK